jgi:hypothetical protein
MKYKKPTIKNLSHLTIALGSACDASGNRFAADCNPNGNNAGSAGSCYAGGFFASNFCQKGNVPL